MTAPIPDDLAGRNRRVRNLLLAVAIGLFVLSLVYVGLIRKP